ncbi:hypothetical protein EUX98_g8011 [Antrodiella citrinella]|uniref:REM-1 domain-containing protein n=1 Tax=Antrodiella citrinella TaxID=2447956 RepID=A0A4S4ME28_9APHY|nr:hypothetical protein EUX98_g8011 [Antrodiella citrinella]
MSTVLVDQQPGLAGSNNLRGADVLSGILSQSSTSTAVNGSSSGESLGSDVGIGRNGVITTELQSLNTELLVQNNIKVGAEKFLQQSTIPSDLRQLVESELEMARQNIDDITRKIEDENGRGPRKRAESGSLRRKFYGGDIQVASRHNEDRDDFRSALHQASMHLKTLHTLSRNNTSSASLPSSSSSSVLSDAEISRARVDAMAQLTGVLQRNLRVRYEVNLADVVQAALPALAEKSSKQCRATGYRLIRHLLVDPPSVEKLREQSIDWYIVKRVMCLLLSIPLLTRILDRSLARDNKHAVEREQAIKLVRAMVEIGSQRRTPHACVGTGTVQLSKQIMRALVAVAEHPEDPFKPICVQTLSEILLIDIELMAKTGGIRVLLHALAEGPLEMAPIISSAFLYIVDSPRTRAYLHPGIDLEMVFSGITDAYGRNSDNSDRMRGLTKILVFMLRTWSGLVYFCLNDKLAMRSLIDGLRIPSLPNRDIILDLFFDLLNIKPPDWHEAFIAGRRLTMIRRSRQLSEASKPPETLTRTQEALKLTDQYIALLILVVTKAGLMDHVGTFLDVEEDVLIIFSDGHSRIVLSKALTSSYKHIRMYATNHLGELIRASPTANSWTLRLLLTQLYDPAVEVQEVAVRYLQEACESADILQAVVEMHPTLDHLGAVGHPLLLKFMATTLGFRYLYAADYIDREMDLWFHERNLHYVIYIEVFLSKAFDFTPSGGDHEELGPSDGLVPQHFYGVMAKTDTGCQVLQEKGHFSEFAAFVRRHGLESEDQDLILKLKSTLWAIGNIGATERGLPFLEEEDIIPVIVDIAEQSYVLSVRGTCFFVLGMISSTPQGAEILDDYGWEATLDPLGFPTGLCVPMDVNKLVTLPSWDPTPVGDDGLERLAPPKTEEEAEVMTAIYNLANTVIANTASRSLARMKARPEYRHIFSSTSMLYRALHTMANQRYRLPVRRYICELFNVELNAETVKELLEHETELKLRPEVTENGDVLPQPRLNDIGRPSRHLDSDEETMSDEEMMSPVIATAPVIKARPQSRIVGFAETNDQYPRL